jgi:putative ABC transport system permease protein
MTVIWMAILTAMRALRRNKLRSALTMLGIIIGVAAVITMVSVGAARRAVQQQIKSLGNNLHGVSRRHDGGGARSRLAAPSRRSRSATRRRSRASARPSPRTWIKRQVVQVVYGNANWSTSARA